MLLRKRFDSVESACKWVGLPAAPDLLKPIACQAKQKAGPHAADEKLDLNLQLYAVIALDERAKKDLQVLSCIDDDIFLDEAK